MAIQFPDISPVAFHIGSFSIRWYSLAYLFGILFAWGGLAFYAKREKNPPFTLKQLENMVTWGIAGIVFGGRLGYVMFYNLSFYLDNPLKIFYLWDGGMSFHGGLIGVMAVVIFFCLKNKIDMVRAGDFVVLVSPIGLMLGRIANFINGELYGRVASADFAYGVIFPRTDGRPRHASQLYEAFFEGFLLFAILNLLWMAPKLRGMRGLFVGLFFTLYSSFRFGIEFVRQPDAQIGYIYGHFTMGQILCLPMFVFGISFIIYAITGCKKGAKVS